ncbi:hypothetical protein [Sphingorhabdus contaminans]|uniref:hypothetical protein n=1 Tax=Sphingorhabdus contaminans TaxID=1343899 RepID=UPI003D280DDD
MPKSVPNSQVKAVAIAMAGATMAAVATMFVPVTLLESVTGATGLSELVPAARAPLGDTARALIAFGTGAFTLSALTYLLLRFDGAAKQRPAPAPVAEPSVPDWMMDEEEEKPGFADRLARFRMPALSLPKMPWQHDEDAITELADLPKLRNGDTHPDAPPRRPLLATQDLPVLDLADIATEVTLAPAAEEPAVEEIGSQEPVADMAVAEMAPEPVVPLVEELPTVAPVAAEDVQPTLAEMVAQLEAAVAERQKQLAELESVAAILSMPQPAAQADEDAHVQDVADADISIEPTRDGRPALEVVHDVTAVEDDNMDSALAAALATLKRMNGTAR